MMMPASEKEIARRNIFNNAEYNNDQNLKTTEGDPVIMSKSMKFHLQRLANAYEMSNAELEAARLELKELGDELERRQENVLFMNREALHARKTLRRKIAERLMKYNWYFPIENREKLSLGKGWDYYEYNILPRHFCDEKAKNSVNLERASPGEYTRDTKLYNPFFTPHEELADFGVGVGLYFSILRFFCLLLFLAALFNIYLMAYYQSEDYSDFKFEGNWLTNSSAICTSTEYVPCLDCDFEKWDSTSLQKKRFRVGKNFANATDTIPFVLKNHCPFMGFDRGIGYLFCTMGLVLVGIFVTNYFVQKGEKVFDVNIQTAQDYSVEVVNPPPDSYNPNEWRKYFQMVTKRRVTLVTIALDNHKLLKCLVERRRLLQILTNKLKTAPTCEEHPSKLDVALYPNRILRESIKYGDYERSRKNKPLSTKLSQKIESLLRRDPISLVYKVEKLKVKIRSLSSPDIEYKVKRVFLTFEEEEGKRDALRLLGSPVTKKDLPQFQQFRGTVPLVVEPSEPGSIRWTDIGNDNAMRHFLYVLHVCTISSVVVVVGLILNEIQGNSVAYAFIVYFIGNILGPFLCQILHDAEVHSTDRSYHVWLFIKVFLFKIGLTVFALASIVPNTSTLEESDGSMIITLHWIFIFDVVVHPIVRLVDLREIFYQHYLAPRAKSQEDLQMIFFNSTPPQNIVYSYADMYKILMLCLLYSILYPAGLFLGSFYMFVYYFIDRYCLMRHWAPFPDVGTLINEFSRTFAQPICLIGLALLSSNFIAGFPFDNLCESTSSSIFASELNGNIYRWGDTDAETFQVESNSKFYKYCDQDVLRRFIDGGDTIISVKPVESSNMYKSPATDSQFEITEAFLYTALSITVLYAVLVYGRSLINLFIRVICKTSNYDASNDGKLQNIDFSNVGEIFGYVPQIGVAELIHPLLLCDLDMMENTNLIGFDLHDSNFGKKGSVQSYDYHNVIFDSPYVGMKRGRHLTEANKDSNGFIHSPIEVPEKQRTTPIFATVKYWPPSWTFDVGDGDDLKREQSFSNFA